MNRLVRTTDLRLILRIDARTFPDDKPVDVLDTNIQWWKYGELAYCGIRRTNEPGLAFMVRSGVVPEARGQGLQKRMILKRLAWANREGFTEVCSYTVTDNAPSMRNLVRCGFEPYDPPERWAGEVVYWSKQIS